MPINTPTGCQSGPQRHSPGRLAPISRFQRALVRASKLHTVEACQFPPRDVGTPQGLSASEMSQKVLTPVDRMASTIGNTFAVCSMG